MSKRQFHHGNLREALIELATEQLAHKSYRDLSLRNLASKLGVASSAPYRHFKNKDELLLAVVERMLARLYSDYEAAAKLDASPSQRLRAACKAYLDLSASHPELYSLTLDTKVSWQLTFVEDGMDSTGFGLFRKMVGDTMQACDAKAIHDEAVVRWSTLHGFAMLRISGLMKEFSDPAQMEEQILSNVSQAR